MSWVHHLIVVLWGERLIFSWAKIQFSHDVTHLGNASNGQAKRTKQTYSLCLDDCFINRAATRENRSSGFPTRSDTNRPVQAQKRARSLQFWI